MFDSTALLGVLRPFRILAGDRNARSFWMCRAGELLADWLFIVALLVTVFSITSDTALVALFMFARVLPRAVVLAMSHDLTERIGTRGLFLLSLPRIPLIASLAFVNSRSDLIWAGAVVVGYGLLTALSNEIRASIVPHLVARPRLATVIQLNAAIERLSFVAGPLLAALVLWIGDVDVAMFASAALLLVVSLLLKSQSQAVQAALRGRATIDQVHPTRTGWTSTRRHPGLLLLAGSLFAGAALAISVNVLLVELVLDSLERSTSTYGVLLSLVGFGTLLGPLSVPRLLGHLPLSMIVTGSTIGIATGILLISVVTRLEIVVVVLLGLGIISITNDLVTATAIRRVAPEADLPGTSRLMVIAIVTGQLVAAAAVAGLATFWDATEVMLAVGVVSALVMATMFVLADGRSLVTRRLARS